ncbi:thaumatin [Sporodiniella umbellata]|nr:thaumatin [Sporodiniella umbellata]
MVTLSLASFLALISLGAMAAPTTSSGSISITVKNSCSNSIQVNQLTNGGGAGKSSALSAGGSTTINVDSNWGGRIWAREGCNGGSDCQSGSPASLAEFLMSGSGGKDYYDVSFVDGYNLPISIAPNGGKVEGEYECGTPSCSSLPQCPEELQDKRDGKVVGCKSACSAFGTGEYCCTGEAEARGACKASKFSAPVKEACPNVYTFAQDDSTSMYACSPSNGYTVTFC